MKTTITTTVDVNLKEKASALMLQQKVKMSELVSRALKKYLEENADESNDN